MIKFEAVREGAVIPSRSTAGSAGYDLYAMEDIAIEPNGVTLVKTGVTAQMPIDVEMQVRSRSGLAFKYGVFVLNSPGTVDADYYPNEIGVILANFGHEVYLAKKGERIAQAVFSRYLVTVDDDAQDTREGGFGSTGR